MRPLIIAGPRDFSFAPSVDAVFGALVESDEITLAGPSKEVWPLCVRGSGSPQLLIAGGSWGTFGVAVPGDTLKLRLTAATSGLTERVASLHTPGGIKTFSVTTADLTPPPSTVADHHVHWAKMTGAITAGVGDDLDSVPDISGNGNHYTYVSGTKAKLQQDSGGRYYAHFTADCVYRMPALTDHSTWSWVGSYIGVASGTTGGRMVAAELTADNCLLGTWGNHGPSKQLIGQCYLNGGVAFIWSGSDTGLTTYYYDILVQNGSGAVYYNNGTDRTNSSGNTRSLNPGGMKWCLGGGYASSTGGPYAEFFRGRFYGDCFANAAWSSGDRAVATTYIRTPTDGV